MAARLGRLPDCRGLHGAQVGALDAGPAGFKRREQVSAGLGTVLIDGIHIVVARVEAIELLRVAGNDIHLTETIRGQPKRRRFGQAAGSGVAEQGHENIETGCVRQPMGSGKRQACGDRHFFQEHGIGLFVG
jgi:hypothetical protein